MKKSGSDVSAFVHLDKDIRGKWVVQLSCAGIRHFEASFSEKADAQYIFDMLKQQPGDAEEVDLLSLKKMANNLCQSGKQCLTALTMSDSIKKSRCAAKAKPGSLSANRRS